MVNDSEKLLDNSSAITYHRQTATSRVVPYAPVALIGVPVTSLLETRDLLGIPHEFGHYLYWNRLRQEGERNLRDNWICDDTFRTAIDDLPLDANDPVRTWEEEIFADVVGCMIGGPVAALSLQDLQRTVSYEAFFSREGVHPTPAIRPLICLAALEAMPSAAEDLEAMPSAAEDLEGRWRETLCEDYGILIDKHPLLKRDLKNAQKLPKR